VALIDPAAAQVMRLSSEVLSIQATLKAQRDQIETLLAVIDRQERGLRELEQLAEFLLSQGSPGD